MKLIIADRQDIAKAGIRYYASALNKDIEVVCAENKEELLAILRADCKAETMVVLDYTNFDFESADDILITQERFTGSYWLLFSQELSEDFLRKMLLTNTRTSVVTKDCKEDEITFGLRSMLQKERYICHYVSNLLLNGSFNKPKEEEAVPLTATEKVILKEIAQGKTTKEIAADRCLSFHTVNTHRKNIFRKLDVNNVHEAIKYAMRAGLVDMADYYI